MFLFLLYSISSNEVRCNFDNSSVDGLVGFFHVSGFFNINIAAICIPFFKDFI